MAARRGGQPGQVELAERAVVARHLALALQDVDFDLRLPVRGSRVDFALAGRDGGVTLNDRGGNSAQGLNRKGEWRDVQEQDVFDIAAQNASLDGCTDGNHFVGINALVGVFAKFLAYSFLYGGHTGHTAYQHYLVDLRGFQAGIF